MQYKLQIPKNSVHGKWQISFTVLPSDKTVSVKWDAKKQTISLQTEKPYTAVGGELAVGADKSATAQESKTTLLVNGNEVTSLTAYNIGGNTYFKLRELGNLLYFDVSYNAVANIAAVESFTFQGCEKP